MSAWERERREIKLKFDVIVELLRPRPGGRSMVGTWLEGLRRELNAPLDLADLVRVLGRRFADRRRRGPSSDRPAPRAPNRGCCGFWRIRAGANVGAVAPLPKQALETPPAG